MISILQFQTARSDKYLQLRLRRSLRALFPYKQRHRAPSISQGHPMSLANHTALPSIMHHVRLLLAVLCLAGSCGLAAASAAPTVTLQPDTRKLQLAPIVQVYKDPSGKQSLTDILSPTIQTQFKPSITSDGAEINFGFTEATYWLKLRLNRMPQAAVDWILEIPYLSLNRMVFYAPGQPPVHVGTDFSSEKKPLFYPLYALPLKVDTNPQDYYLQIQSDYALSIPLTLWSRAAFSRQFSDNLLGQALYFGGLLSLALYNFLLFLSLRERSYLIYTGFAVALGLGMFAGNGYGRLYFWPDAPQWDNIAQTTFFGLSGALSLLFATSFLRTRQAAPRLNLVLHCLSALYLIAVTILIASLWGHAPASMGFQLVLMTTIPATLGTLAAGILTLRRGNRSALYFLIACGAVWLGATVAALRAFDFVPTNGLTLYALQIGSCLEMLLLSFALAHRIHTERDQRLVAQEAALHARNELLAISQENELVLERKVKERTALLQQLALNEKEVRQEYVRFGAMISHEFRNPLSIIETQAALVQREIPLGINKAEERAEIILSATHRLARLFDQWICSDQLQQPISVLRPSTITLTSLISPVLAAARGMHRSHKIQCACIPELSLSVDPALIEIALLNLIDNACKYASASESVDLGFAIRDDMIGITVTDHGPGLPASQQAAIFQPYFRAAKEKNAAGYGLGLAFVTHIAGLHHGRVAVSSPPQGGCQFTLWLPHRSV